MKIKKALSTLLLPVVLAGSMGIANAATRRRAVAPPPTPNYLVPITSKAPVSITNHDSKDARLTACYLQNSALAGCDTETLQPENTFVYTPANDGMVTVTSASPLEIRSTVDGTRVDNLIDNIGYIATVNQATLDLTVFTDSNTTYEAKLRDEFGNILADVTKTATPYTISTQSVADFFGTPFLRDIAQVEIIPQSGRLGAYLTNANGTSQAVRSQDLSNEVFLNAQAFVQTNPTGQSVVQSTYVYPADQDNSNVSGHTDVLLTPHEARNTNMTSAALNAAVRLYATQPIMVPGMLTAADAALAKSGSFENQNESVNDVSVANVSGNTPITVWNISSNPNNVAPLTITGEVDVYSNGTQTSKQFTLRQYENHTYTLADFGVSSGNVRLHLNNDPNVGMNIQPRALLAVDGKRPYKVMPATEKVTGEEYVATWLDPLKTQYFYLKSDPNNPEVHCMISGACGTRSYAPDMAAILARGTNSSSSPSQIEAGIRAWDASGLLAPKVDNLLTDMRNNPQPGVRWYFAPDGTRVGDTYLTPSDAQAWFTMVRSYLVERVNAHPEAYGGNQTKGPDIRYPAHWETQLKY